MRRVDGTVAAAARLTDVKLRMSTYNKKHTKSQFFFNYSMCFPGLQLFLLLCVWDFSLQALFTVVETCKKKKRSKLSLVKSVIGVHKFALYVC